MISDDPKEGDSVYVGGEGPFYVTSVDPENRTVDLMMPVNPHITPIAVVSAPPILKAGVFWRDLSDAKC